MTKEKEEVKNKDCQKCNLEKLHKDVKNSIIILKRIDRKAEINKNNLESIKQITLESAKELSINTLAVSENLKQASETNRELIEIIAGKKQVPLSIFLIIIAIFAIVQFMILVSIFGIKMKFGSFIFDGEIKPFLYFLGF